MKTPQDFKHCAEALKSLADSDRLRIVSLLLEGEKNVGEIAEALDEEIVKVSHHLGILRHAKIVTSTKDGRYVVYALHPEVFIAPTGPDDELQLQLGCCHIGLVAARSRR